jgi:hypothetical protein
MQCFQPLELGQCRRPKSTINDHLLFRSPIKEEVGKVRRLPAHNIAGSRHQDIHLKAIQTPASRPHGSTWATDDKIWPSTLGVVCSSRALQQEPSVFFIGHNNKNLLWWTESTHHFGTPCQGGLKSTDTIFTGRWASTQGAKNSVSWRISNNNSRS